MLILSTASLGNIQYFSHLVRTDRPVVIDVGEHYRKQSYRNRYDILGGNGPITLVIPVLKKSGEKTVVKEVRIDPTKNWRHQHWNSVESAYRNSPYFDYYADELRPFYEKTYDFLVDFNTQIQGKLMELAGITAEFAFCETYVEAGREDTDLRDALSPKARLKREDPGFAPLPYYQVFSERFPFVPNLSFLDLLFCEGPAAAEVLNSSRTDYSGARKGAEPFATE